MNTHSGSSLLEIVISFFIFSLLLLGLDAMQITALREAKSTYYFNVANRQIQGMAERLRVVEEGDWQETFNKWNQQNQEVLPQGRGEVQGRYPSYTISLIWKTKKGQSECLSLDVNV